jgi:hypothetical protein
MKKVGLRIFFAVLVFQVSGRALADDISTPAIFDPFKETPTQYNARAQWLRDAKLGVFAHWNPSSVYPLPKDLVNRFPMGKINGQITPWTATLDEIQDGIQDAPPINRWASAFWGNREHRLKVNPLGIREAGLIYGVFHAPTEAALKIGRQTPSRMSTHPVIIRSLAINHPSQLQHPFE